MKKWLAQLTIPLLGLLSLVAAQTLTNLTVDDSDPRIVYVGNWESAARHTSALDYGGTHVLSSDPLGSATFSFTGRSTLLARFSSLLTFTLQPNDERGRGVLFRSKMALYR